MRFRNEARAVLLSSTFVAVAVGLVAPAQAAAPFGKIQGQVGGGNAVTGSLKLTGWALDDDGVAAVDIFVDGAPAGRAFYGRSRPGVTAKHPGFPDSLAPGWAIQVDTTHFLNGKHVIAAVVISETGERTTLQSKAFTFNNNTHTLLPFGEIEFPNRNAELLGKCNLNDSNRRYSVISGYALDSGIQDQDRGVGYVELMIDRALWANSKADCHDVAAKGGLSDCYGLRRLDIEQTFPTLPDSPHSGFRFVLDVGELLTSGFYNPGLHTVSIRVGDVANQIRRIAEIPVFFRCMESIPNEGAIGEIDQPGLGVPLGGDARVTGWALDWEGVTSVAISINGVFAGNATLGLSRPAVTSNYPGFPQSAAPGWRFDFDTRELSNGIHSLQVIVTDVFGATNLIGELTFLVANPLP